VRKLRILIADDHGLVRRGARALLQARRGWKVVGEAANGRDALEKAKELKPDVAIVDISMPELDGVEVVRQVREAVPNTQVLVLTMHESDEMVRRALAVGARGYLLKSDLTECLAKAVGAIAEGKRFLTPKVSEIVLDGFLKTKGQHQQVERVGVKLTPRETQIIRLLAEGRSNKEIASELAIAVRTVETHRAKIMSKLGFHSLAELIHYAMRNGIISAPSAAEYLANQK
jgi:DNA-binding NarL/FixJ family response regulator